MSYPPEVDIDGVRNDAFQVFCPACLTFANRDLSKSLMNLVTCEASTHSKYFRAIGTTRQVPVAKCFAISSFTFRSLGDSITRISAGCSLDTLRSPDLPDRKETRKEILN